MRRRSVRPCSRYILFLHYLAAIAARHLMFGAGTTKFLMLAPFWFPVWLTVQGISPVHALSVFDADSTLSCLCCALHKTGLYLLASAAYCLRSDGWHLILPRQERNRI